MKEINLAEDKKTCVARRAVDEQPNLVTGGMMKDYQASVQCTASFCILSRRNKVGWIVISHLDV